MACYINILNNLLPEIIQDQRINETKMREVLRTLRAMNDPEMPYSKGF